MINPEYPMRQHGDESYQKTPEYPMRRRSLWLPHGDESYRKVSGYHLTINAFCFLFAVLCFLLFTACCRTAQEQEQTGLDTITLKIGKVQCTAEIARTPDQRRTGLKFRKALAPESGMLFIYPSDRIPAFWMQDTYVPLSIAFIDPAGMIVNIQDMEPLSEDLHSPSSRVRYALEMNKGWFAQKGISVGDAVFGLPLK